MKTSRVGTLAMAMTALGFMTCLAWVVAEASPISGRVVDARTGEPIPAATIRWAGTNTGTVCANDGTFELGTAPEGATEVIVRRVGYRPWRRTLRPGEIIPEIRIEPVMLPGQDIVVTTTRAVRGQSPVAFDNITREEIQESYHTQSVPMLLTESPGVYAYSDDGIGVGYSYLSIRGFSQRRVTVLVNGVPLNDPESHEVYWIDLPDLPEGTHDIQVQRGVGTTLYGSNSIGGTVNLQTYSNSPVRDITVTSGIGSYDTRKFSVSGSSGLVDDRYSFDGRFSRVVSDGYRDNSWTDLWAYFFSGARYDEKWTNRLNIFGGPEQTHLAYKGLPRRFIEGDTTLVYNGDRPTGNTDADRRYNPFKWNNENDNFNQPQYQWISEFRPDTNWLFENTLFYIKGKGYYDQLRFGRDFDEYNLTQFTQPIADGDSIVLVNVDKAQQLWRRRWVENDFWGIIPRVTRRHNKGVLTLGGEFQRHNGDHWAEVQSAVPAPPDFIPGQRYYDYQGQKTVVSGFAQEVYTLTPRVTLTGAFQYSFKEYRVFDDRFANFIGQRVSYATRYSFLSPRAGVTIRPNDRITVFGSVSYNEQEPMNVEIFDPTDWWANASDYFATFNQETGRGSDPVMRPERLVDFELGGSVAGDRWRLDLNLFHMQFHDEIVWNGQLNDDGVPIRINAARTIHQGIELAGEAKIWRGLSLRGNVSINDNTFDDFVEQVFDWDEWTNTPTDRKGNFIAGFPKHMANLRVTFDRPDYAISGHVFRAGRIFVDNSNSIASSIEPYTILNARGEIKLDRLVGLPGLRVVVHLNNVLGKEYETGGYFDDGYPLFIPAAKRNFYAGLRANL